MQAECFFLIYIYSISPNQRLLEKGKVLWQKDIFVLLPEDIQIWIYNHKQYYYCFKWHKNIDLTLHAWGWHGWTLDKNPFSGVWIGLGVRYTYPSPLHEYHSGVVDNLNLNLNLLG